MMQMLSADAFEAMTAGATTITSDRFGIKVYERPDGVMLKLFRRKRLLSSTLLVPYARRFEVAARRLAAMGVPTVEVLDVLRVPAISRHLVRYRRLDGRPLRDHLADSGDPAILADLAALLARLHEAGVYFRAIHFGNVIVLPGGELGLIDLDEARFKRGRLRIGLRARNFRHLLRYDEDRGALDGFGFARFRDCYVEASGFAAADSARLVRRLHRDGSPFGVG